MQRDVDRNQQIARPVTGRGVALPLEPDLLAGHNAGRNLDIELLAGRQPDPLLHTPDRLLQRNRHGDGKIEIKRDGAGVELEGAAASARPRAARRLRAEHAVEDVLKSAAAKAAGARAAAAAGMGLEAAGTRTGA